MTKECAQGHVIADAENLCSRCNGQAVNVDVPEEVVIPSEEASAEIANEETDFTKPTTVPQEVITDQMAEAGVTSDTPMVSRESLVEEMGEEAVANIEANTATPEEVADMPATE